MILLTVLTHAIEVVALAAVVLVVVPAILRDVRGSR